MNNLFGYIPQRPKWGESARIELAKRVGKIVFDWSGDKDGLQEYIECANGILEHCSSDNGYELAKEFEDAAGCSPDAYLVDALDDVMYIKDNVMDEFIKKWVVENSLKLDLEIGQKVKAEIRAKGVIDCEIVKLYPDTMQYGVWYEGSGCERDKWHTIKNYEDVKT
jgi:hypothetical protein